MKLWILRHGEAQPHAPRDADRELTPLGCEQVLRSAEQLRSKPLNSIWVSPYVRAQQTAALVREALGFTSDLITVPWLTQIANLNTLRVNCPTTHMSCWSAISLLWGN